MTSNRVYLAGPMRGRPQFNFPAFLHAAQRLRWGGYEVISPAERDLAAGFQVDEPDLAKQGFDLGAAFRFDVEAICRANLVVFLPGWEQSVGCRLEFSVARACCVPCYEFVGDSSSGDPMDYGLREILAGSSITVG